MVVPSPAVLYQPEVQIETIKLNTDAVKFRKFRTRSTFI